MTRRWSSGSPRRGVRILFTGDLSACAEARGSSRVRDRLGADVLKVPHHGSGDADPAFAASGACVALISVGADNTYGHPTRRLLTWLSQAGMRVHRTDRDGDRGRRVGGRGVSRCGTATAGKRSGRWGRAPIRRGGVGLL